MLRLIVLLLLLANGTYFAWSQGLLLSWGFGPAQQSEPQRLEQQVRPEALRLVGRDEAGRIENSAATAGPPECLQAGPIDDGSAQTLRQVLQLWPDGSWSLEPVAEPARWIIYMGKYPRLENLNRKKAELRQLGVSFEAVTNPALEFGLSLGGFSSQAAATQQLERLAETGVQTAKVVQERPEVRGQRLTLRAMDEALRMRLDELRPALGTAALRSCR
jgi:hypothetical protein